MGRKDCKALIAFLCLLAGCVKDKPPAPARITPGNTGKAFIICEGNYGLGNASLYAWEPAKDSVFGDVYKSVNSATLGDVFQSMVKIGGLYFLCINNSDKIIAVNAGDLSYAGAISIPKPRYILPVNSSKAYVSSEYHNKVFVINPAAMQITDSIILPYKNTEGMRLYDDNVFVCTWDTACNFIYKIGVSTNSLIQTIKVAGYAPQEALLDKFQTLWVLSGNQPEGRPCAWTRIDPSTGDILASYSFPPNVDAIRPIFNNSRDTLYFIEADYYGGTANNGIYRMSINDKILPSQPFVAAKQLQYFWALGIEPATGYVYVGDPKGFVQKGSVYIFRPDGVAIDTFNVGLGPGHFYFDE